MRIIDKLRKDGDFLFRWRSYFPIIIIPVIVASYIDFSYPDNSYFLNLLWELGCFTVSLIGIVIRIIVSGTVPEGTSGRNTKAQKASTLNTSGLYSVVRNPLYLGNYFIALGISLLPREWYLPVIISLAFFLYYERIIAREEEFLEEKFGERFKAWAAMTSVIIPHIRGYRRSQLLFNLKTALRKEFHGIFGVIATFFLMDLIGVYSVQKMLVFNQFWIYFFLAGLLFYIIMMILKKRTKILRVEGR
ncbi:MAG: hypothetical protein A2Y48_06995 [Nitrospirae bacterium RIFCSPLOW2_12_42_9]|nr:MAG: hypothetical protein A2Y48_06995 [Nitrospirae bacterium RIFCSPLOW2_12_42_9]